jgi:hypothetical protein
VNTELDLPWYPLDPQRSPVFIGVRRRAPQIISVGQPP